MAKNVGFRFRPTNEELVNYYLKKKIFDRDFSVSRIKELDIYKFEPWDLPLEFPNQSKDKTWYCYCFLNRYANSKTTSRKTRAGYWKITAKDRVIQTKSGCKKGIGVKKILTFYKHSKESKRDKGIKTKEIKTEWVMHEYHYNDIPVDKKSYVLCHIKKKPNNHRASTNKDSSSQHLASNIGSEALDNPHLEVGPSLVAQSDILNDVIGMQHDLSSVDQSLILSQPITFNNTYVDTSSPGEVQSSNQISADEITNFLCALENESSNVDIFNNNQLIKDDSTDLLWALENGYLYLEPPSNIYNKVINPRVREYSSSMTQNINPVTQK